MKDALIVSLLSLVPRNSGARWMGRFARTGASRIVTRLFVRAYGVNLGEARGEITDYKSLEDLFTRELVDGARPIDLSPEAIVSPVDGTVGPVGRTRDGRIEVAPGRTMRVDALVGEPVDGERDVVVLYLSPRDYHRVHVPREGRLARWRYKPGTLWPVFPAAVRQVDGLYEKNERLCLRLDTSAGPLDVVLVGAFGVGRISVPFADIVTNARGAAAEGAVDADVARSDLLGVFHLGSTVVLVAPPGRWTWAVKPGESVRVGRAIGQRAGS